MICPAHLDELGDLLRSLFRQQPNRFAGYDTAISAQLRGNPSDQSVLSLHSPGFITVLHPLLKTTIPPPVLDAVSYTHLTLPTKA